VIVVNRNQDPIRLWTATDYTTSCPEPLRGGITKTTMYDLSVMPTPPARPASPGSALPSGLIQQHATGKWVLDLHEDDVYWCTADPGWVTGTSYGILAPWSNGVTQVVYEGGFKASAWYEVIERHKVTVWYTAPTAIRMLMKAGTEIPKRHDLSSLRHILSVGEPLNPEAISWGLPVFRRPIHDSWWQTETGAILISNYAAMDIRSGSMGKPIPGIQAAILDDHYDPTPTGTDGHLAIRPGGVDVPRVLERAGPIQRASGRLVHHRR
jgi:acetyl-CoA synthetase